MINSTMFLTICSLFYSILLLLFVFKNINLNNTFKGKMYKGLILSNFVGIVIELLCVYTCINYKKIPTLNLIALKGFLIYLLTWITFFALYIFGIAYPKEKILKLKKKVKIISIIAFAIMVIVVIVLPIDYVVKNDVIMYTTGQSVQSVFVISEAVIILCLFFMFRNAKTFKGDKYAPLFIFIAGGAFAMVIQSMYPEWLLMTAMETFVTFLIHFTSEKDTFFRNSLSIDKKKLEK